MTTGLLTRTVYFDRAILYPPSADDVAHAYRIGLTELQREDSPRFVMIPESDRPVVQVRGRQKWADGDWRRPFRSRFRAF